MRVLLLPVREEMYMGQPEKPSEAGITADGRWPSLVTVTCERKVLSPSPYNSFCFSNTGSTNLEDVPFMILCNPQNNGQRYSYDSL